MSDMLRAQLKCSSPQLPIIVQPQLYAALRCEL
jgi:hypothetical protein